MKKFVVRKGAEYSLQVEAESSEEAVAKAHEIPLECWDVAWSDVEQDENEIEGGAD